MCWSPALYLVIYIWHAAIYCKSYGVIGYLLSLTSRVVTTAAKCTRIVKYANLCDKYANFASSENLIGKILSGSFQSSCKCEIKCYDSTKEIKAYDKGTLLYFCIYFNHFDDTEKYFFELHFIHNRIDIRKFPLGSKKKRFIRGIYWPQMTS